jgi:hypothetical protein
MEGFWYLLAGAVAFNAIPHVVKGISGEPHMTPFRRVSSPLVNVVWGFANLVGSLLVLRVAGGPSSLLGETNLRGMNLVMFLAGGFATAVYLAWFWSNPAARLPWHRD